MDRITATERDARVNAFKEVIAALEASGVSQQDIDIDIDMICDTCRGTGVRTVMHPDGVQTKPVPGGFSWSTTVGAQIPTKRVPCDRCEGQRVLKRVKAITYERVSAPEPTP